MYQLSEILTLLQQKFYSSSFNCKKLLTSSEILLRCLTYFHSNQIRKMQQINEAHIRLNKCLPGSSNEFYHSYARI